MRVSPAAIPDVLVLEQKVFSDARGFFYESYTRRAFARATGLDVEFVQDNHSRSAKNVLRGLHYQVRQPQGKLVRALHGAIFDVAVDLRKRSPSFGKWVGVELSAESKRQAYIPPGFAHGFLVISEHAEVLYKTTDYYAPEHERTLRWDDPAIGIAWPLEGLRGEPSLSEKDRRGVALSAAEAFA
jgi:dTDP-4-dehydrorhamnose 3,5-epimerase